MTNNKLKNMIENHELDDFVTNTDLSNKLRNTKTSEEVLELLKKYNYNESKEVLEVELMDLLKEFVDEEELMKVSGGKNNKKSFSNIITSLAVAGSLCMPVQGVTGVQKKEKREDRKSSYSVGLPPKEKAGLGVCGIVGVGVLLGEVLRRKVFAKKDKHCRVLTDQKYEEMRDHFMKIATRPQECNSGDFKQYTLRELADYMFEELLKWFQYMEQYHQIDGREHCVTKGKCAGTGGYAGSFVATWNDNLPKLVCITLAIISVHARLQTYDDRTLQHYLDCIRQPAEITDLQKKTIRPKTWAIDKNHLTQLGVSDENAKKLKLKIAHNTYTMTSVLNLAVLAYVIDLEATSEDPELPIVKNETLVKAEKALSSVTNYVQSKEYTKFRKGLKITT